MFFRKSRFAPLFVCLGFYLVLSTALRIYLAYRFGPIGIWNDQSLHAFLIGIRMDLAAGLLLLLPLSFWLALIPQKLFTARWHRVFLLSAVSLFCVGQVFTAKVEIEFFNEFNARFNTVAVDYLIYPHEVFVNLWQSYPIVQVLLASLLLGLAVALGFRRAVLTAGDNDAPLKSRAMFLICYLALAGVAKATVSYDSTRFSQDRVVNELSSNGLYSFAYAASTRDLDYTAYYKTLPLDDAYARARALVSQPGVAFTGEAHSIERLIPGQEQAHPRNLVIILVESFGSEFWGVLNPGQPSWTPEMDKLSSDGLLFTNLHASGNRTVRGMEGVLASFPPLPGDSIVKRHLSDNVATVARTLKKKGYETLFLYGGRGVFDGMRSFCVRNGYDRFIEQKDIPHPTFTTIWGVCDEDLFHRTIEELRALENAKKPFFATVLTVSNHQPYTYPEGRIPENPAQHARPYAVKYTDFAIGQFFHQIKDEPFMKDTIFAVVADHGARVYGSQTIPIKSYQIPLLIVGAGVKPGTRNDNDGSSIDVGPTLLGLIGLPYRSNFFGRDLQAIDPKSGWAVLNHNRDVSLFRDGKMVVLGINKALEYYQMKDGDIVKVPGGALYTELENDAAALYQVANDLYMNKLYVTP